MAVRDARTREAASSAVDPLATPWLTRWARSLALMASGAAIAFTAVLHTNMVFNRVTMAVSFLLIAAAFVLESRAQQQRNTAHFAQIIIAAVAAVMQLFTANVVVFATVIAAWAVLTAVIEAVYSRTGALATSDSRLLIIFASLLAIATFLAREDSVAVIGFFGAYGVLTGVFLAILIADTRMKRNAALKAAANGAGTDDAEVTEGAATGEVTDEAVDGTVQEAARPTTSNESRP